VPNLSTQLPAPGPRSSPTAPSSRRAQDFTSRTTEPPRTSEVANQAKDAYRQQHLQYQSDANPSTGRSTATSAPRPVSAMYTDPDQAPDPNYGLRSELSGSSIYGAPARTNSDSTSIYPTPIPSRESSQRDRSYNPPRQMPLPPGTGPLPPRRSSRGQGGGYASSSASAATAGVPASVLAAPQTNPYGPDMPLPASSEEWKDRGAAVGVRREMDANGKMVIRHVKKGVRDFNFGRILGEGSYSTVFLATDRQTLKEYAIKVLEKKHIIKEKKIKYVNIEKNTLNRLTQHQRCLSS